MPRKGGTYVECIYSVLVDNAKALCNMKCTYFPYNKQQKEVQFFLVLDNI